MASVPVAEVCALRRSPCPAAGALLFPASPGRAASQGLMGELAGVLA